MTNVQEFKAALDLPAPPPSWPEALKVLWFDAKGDWEASHDIAQEMPDDMGSWLHAYLHRKEGDAFNAGYWYRRAGRSYCNDSFEQEHLALLKETIARNQ